MVVGGYIANGALTWGVPLGVLLAVGIYWAIFVKRHPGEF
jgi:hypothetical protein